MNEEKDIREEIQKCAERLRHYNNLLIKQCDSWLSEEEGNRNMEKQIMERKKKRTARQTMNND